MKYIYLLLASFLFACTHENSELLGKWGDIDTRSTMNVNIDNVFLDFPCAIGEIPSGLPEEFTTIEKSGTYTIQGGAILFNRIYQAKFSFTLKDDVMNVVITDTETNDLLGTHSFKYGTDVTVFKCP